ncbi:apolipoprotein N-acyltransferase [Sphingomonas crusticola]|uniref:apolipoprotein N-acyltransferase n=1 Tax=Sphingomonas crusticola TaxID=1697973 RepID=UPI000E26C5F1|nr:apolipoprotein N-acyltransferase [Sphingomonas crusticola]
MPVLGATRAYPLAFVLGVIAACGFAPLELWPLTLLCFAGLIALLEQAATWRRAAALGWWLGLGHFCLGLNWIATAFTYQAAMPAWLGWVAVILVSIYLAAFPALATAVAWWLARRWRSPLMLGLAATWIISELVRATLFTGFAWNPLAAIWAPVWPVRGFVAVIGTYGLSGVTVLTAGLIWKSVHDRKSAVSLLAIFIVGSGSALLRSPTPEVTLSGPLLHVVQPNIGQENKWDQAHSADNYRRLATLSGKPGPRPRVVLWPEVAIPAILEQDELARRSLAALLGPRDVMLTGAETIRFAPDGRLAYAANSLFALDAEAHILGRYDKAHLVPYGEYLPMRPILSRVGLSRLAPGDADFNSGPGPRNVELPGIGKIGVQICYEIIFSGHVIDRAHRPMFLFNPSNDAWFGRWGPPQHLAQARLRAAEEGLPVVRSTPTGISAVIDAGGRLLGALPWRTAGAIELPLPPAHAPTLFARFGNILPLALALFLFAIGFASRRRAS